MDPLWHSIPFQHHAARLLRSHLTLTGRELILGIDTSAPAAVARQVFEAAQVIVSHGTQADPILNFGNVTALNLWEMTWEEFTRTPSRLTAEPPNREERARLLAEVTARGFIDNYSGIRISKTGRRFRIERATVWNVLDESGIRIGQAATFDRWFPLD
jgi:hypothetical protein